MSFRLRLLLQLAGLVLLSSMLFAQSQSTPLGDLARAPKQGKRAAKVYTNDEIPASPSEPAAAEAAAKDAKIAAAEPAAPAASSDAGKQTPADSNLQQLKAREAKLIQDRDKMQQSLQTETEPLRQQAMSEMLGVISADLLDVQQQIAQRSKANGVSKSSDVSAPAPTSPSAAPK